MIGGHGSRAVPQPFSNAAEADLLPRDLLAPPLGVLLSLSLLAPAARPQDPDPGYTRTYVIQADAAWVAPGEVVSPAFVQISEGRIDWVSNVDQRVAPRGPFGAGEKPPLLKVEGTLAPGIVDAWSGLVPPNLLGERRARDTRRMREALPALYAGEDMALVAQVLAARQSGLAAVYMTTGTSGLRSGVGTAAAFGLVDLPYAAGREALDCAIGAAAAGGPQASYQAEELAGAFRDARAWRDSLEDYDEQLEKYDKDLEEYAKKLDEFVKKEDRSDKDKPPSRPKRPKQPQSDPARDLLLDAFDGRLQVRVRAESAADVRAVLSMKDEFELDLVLVGGLEADLLAEELADARIPVVMAAGADVHPARGGPRDFAARWMRLHDAGVEVAIASGGAEGLLLARAGEVIAAGADADAVWASLTTVPAHILGLPKHGSMAAGADATLILFAGNSPFDASAPFKTHKPK